MNSPEFDPLHPKVGESLDEWARRMPRAYLVGQKKSLSYVFAKLNLAGTDPILEAIKTELQERSNDDTNLSNESSLD